MNLRLGRRRHPTYETLSLQADGDLSAREAMELNSHLAVCDQCREELDFMTELRARLQEISTPGPPRALIADIITGREAGERRLFPLDDVPLLTEERTSGRRSAATIAAALALTTMSIVFFSPGEIEAGASILDLSGTAGHRIDVDFRTTAAGADLPMLTLRGEYYTGSDPHLGVTQGRPIEAELGREEPGTFRGGLALPGDAVYARFVVENHRGEIVGRDPRMEWEYLEKNAEGEPSFDALWRRVMLLQGPAPDLARASLARLLELYPDRADAWAFQVFLDRMRPRSEADLADHRARLSRFVAQLPVNAHPDQLGQLAEYARLLGEVDTEARLLTRLARAEPSHALAVRQRLFRVYADWSNPTLRAAAFEAEWDRYGVADPGVLEAGLATTIELGDPDGARRWGARWRTASPEEGSRIARRVAQLPELGEVALGWLREDLRSLEVAWVPRPFGRTADEHQSRVRAMRARLLSAIGGLLVSRGELEAGADTLALAAEILWDPDLFHDAARALASTGRADVAASYLARAAVDPLDGAVHMEHALRAFEARGLDETRRDRAFAEARARFNAWFLSGPVDAVFARGPMWVLTRSGAPVELGAMLEGSITMLKFWSPAWPASTERLEALLGECERLASASVRLVVVSVDEVAADGPIADSPCPETALFVDSGRAVRERLGVRHLAGEVLVLNDHGRVWSRSTSADDAMRVAMALAARYGLD